MQKLEFKVQGYPDGVQLEHFLRREKGVSLKLLRSLKHQPMGIQCNGIHARTVDLVKDGDIIALTPQEKAPDFTPCPAEVEVLYEDASVIVYNKPAGMPCHPSKGHMDDTLANVFAARCAREGEPRPFRGVYRLDKNTTGAVVAAKTQYAAGRLMYSTSKVYTAIVCGIVEGGEGTVNVPIIQPDPGLTLRAAGEGGQPAVTHYRVLAWGKGYTLLRLNLETGRTHQIRVHMAHIGHPLAGDEWYGGDMELISRHALHCGEVSFPHPESGALVKVTAKWPEDILKAVESACLFIQNG